MATKKVQEIFDHWIEKCRNTGKGLTPRLDTKREYRIVQALKLYTPEELKLAIDGVLKSDFHMGENSRNRKFDDIELILRNSENIEKFAALALDPDTENTVTDATEQFLREA